MADFTHDDRAGGAFVYIRPLDQRAERKLWRESNEPLRPITGGTYMVSHEEGLTLRCIFQRAGYVVRTLS